MGFVTLHKGDNCNFVTEEVPHGKRPVMKAMMKKQTMYFENKPRIIGRMSVVGGKEGEGPIGEYFDKVISDIKMGEKCFETAEINFLREAITGAVNKANLKASEIGLLISGDLLNQMTTSSYVARDLGMPYLGVYSACSTLTESLAIGASLVNAGYYDNVACSAVSHFATAERQFRYPLEYGCQRPPYAQWTVTGSGCSILASEGEGVGITMATLGKVMDFGVNDISNMGAAMAPAAMDTLYTLFKETNTSPKDYDLILTGDLGKLGSDILRDLMREKGYELGQNYVDCGCLIYDGESECYQGGSGCGCSASVFNSYIIDKMNEGVYQKVALLATGALMSTQSCYQGETIPCVSHAVVVEK